MLKNIRASLARLISPPGLPTIALPVAGMEATPAMRIVAQSAPSASAAPVAAAPPLFRRAPVDAEGFTAYQRKMQHEARLKIEFNFHGRLEAAGMDTKARRKVLADFDSFVAARPLGKSAPPPATDEDGTAVPVDAPADTVDKIVEKLEALLAELKKIAGDTGDSDDEVEAIAALNRGDKATAQLHLESAVAAVKAKITAKQSRNPLLSQPSSRARATALIRSGFGSQPAVMALDAALGRGPLAARASLALAPVGGHRAPAPTATTATSPSENQYSRAREIQAELKSIEANYRKTMIYTPEAQARTATLRREFKAEMKRLKAV